MEKKIQEGVLWHWITDIENPQKPYITRYCLDLDMKTSASELRMHAIEPGKHHIPAEYRAVQKLAYDKNVNVQTTSLTGKAPKDIAADFVLNDEGT